MNGEDLEDVAEAIFREIAAPSGDRSLVHRAWAHPEERGLLVPITVGELKRRCLVAADRIVSQRARRS